MMSEPEASASKPVTIEAQQVIPGSTDCGDVNGMEGKSLGVAESSPEETKKMDKDEVSDAEKNVDTIAMEIVENIEEPVAQSIGEEQPDEQVTSTSAAVEAAAVSEAVVEKVAVDEESLKRQPTKHTTPALDSEPQRSKQIEPPPSKAIGSLGLLNQYASSSDDDEDSSSDDDISADSESGSDDTDDSSNNEVLGTPATKNKNMDLVANQILNSVMSRSNYREASSDSSDSDDSDVECMGTIPSQTIDITNEDDIQEFLDSCEANAPSGPIKAKGELGIKDLPPIEELTITVGESECVELGKISGIVDTLVLVESLPGFAAVDIDTVLFLDKGNRTLGQVFDVMGNVSSPIYCVRFNTEQDIQAKNIKTGLQVYVAPQTQYTNFIVLTDLMKEKGCDASWENDHEAPDDCNEFSDDETERLARRTHNQRQRNRNRPSESNGQLPNKVTVKTEPNINPRPSQGHRGRQPRFNRPHHASHRAPNGFYKDNRGYSNTAPGPSGSYYHQQQMPTPPQNHSWHTANWLGTPGPSTNPTPPYVHQHMSNLYPNPFANRMPFGPFSLQSFPPLPPPTSSAPPPTNNPNNSRRHHQN